MKEPSRIDPSLSEGARPNNDESITLLYAEMRKIAASKMAAERPGHTLHATDLVHEAWIRLGDKQHFENRRHFLTAAAEAMRRILVEHARRKQAVRHGGGLERVPMDAFEIAMPSNGASEILEVNELLDELAALDTRKAEVVKLCYFGGHTLEEAGEILGVAERTIKRDWAFAKAWLFDAINGQKGEE